MLKRSTRVPGLLAMLAVVACASRSLDDTPPEGVDSNEAGAAGDATPDGTGGTPAGAAGRGGTTSGGRGGASAGNAGTAPSGNDAGSGGNDATGAGGLDGGTSGNSVGDPCSDGGAGGACSVEHDPTCVTDCWSAARTPAILDADGSWRCPDSAPMRAEECHIDCTALYDGWEENDYVCGAGAFCAPRGLAPYKDACTAALGETNEREEYGCRCTLIPSECPETTDLTRPTWGADGRSYANACEMWQSRMSYPGESEFCPDDRPDHYLCQSVYCREGVEVCEGPDVVDDNSVTWGRCTESACVANGGCACLVEELGPALSPDDESPGPVPDGYRWCSDEVEGRIVLR